MKELKSIGLLVLIGVVGMTALTCSAQSSTGPLGKIRKIRFMQDDAQLYMVTKVYQLKHVAAADIVPWILGAVSRYDHNSQVERLKYKFKKEMYIVVTTAPEMMPYVDKLVAAMDIPSPKDANGSVIQGTGIYRFSYRPKNRSTEEMVEILNDAVKSGDGIVYRNADSNIIYWKDSYSDGKTVFTWAKNLDRPVPQVNLTIKVYELRESTLRDLGIDYLAWKNGPGLNLFGIGAEALNFRAADAVLNTLTSQAVDVLGNFNWGYGAFFVAPQFDLSFVKLLQQSGKAKVAGTASITMINKKGSYSVEFSPAFQNIVKDQDNDKSSIDQGADASIALTVTNPTICFQAPPNMVQFKTGIIPYTKEAYEQDFKGSVLFDYNIAMSSVVERNNFGQELSDTSLVESDLTLEMKSEKLLATWNREQEVEQNIGIPFLCEIPVLKYIFGSTTKVKEKVYFYVTAEANLVHPESALSKFAGRIITDAQMEKLNKK
jgi:hypothetical protein